MKKFIAIFTLISCMFALPGMSALAADSTTLSLGATAVAVAESTTEFYEASVIARIAGRAGSATAKGAKGNVFEVLYADKLNCQNWFKGLKTKLSASSIDQVADLVTTNKKGEIVKMYQLKAGTSVTHILDTMDRVSNGQYADAELIGTSEFAELYNAKAAEKGIEQMATSSNISVTKAEKIANKALKTSTSGTKVFSNVMKNSLFSAGIGAAVSIAESIYRQDDFCTATGNVVTETGISAVSVAVGTMSSAMITKLLTVLGVSAASISVASGIVGIMVPVVSGYALYLIAEETEFQNVVAEVAEELGMKCSDALSAVDSYLKTLAVKENATTMAENVGDCLQWVGNSSKKIFCDVKDGLTESVENISCKITDICL